MISLCEGDQHHQHLPHDPVVLSPGEGVRSRALAHAVQLEDGNVQAHEILQRVFGDGSCTREAGPAAVETQSFPNVLIHQAICHRETPGHGGIAVDDKTDSQTFQDVIQ